MLPIAILAGGVASRLRPITTKVPKALVEVAGQPFIAHQLSLLRREGVEKVVLCVGHLGEQIKSFVGDGRQFGLEVAYSSDGDVLLGTGGALRRALPLLGEAFFVLYGDSYLDVAMEPIELAFRRQNLPALMTVFRNESRWDTSNVLFDGIRVVCYDKRAPSPQMRYIDYGLGVFTAEVLAREGAEQPFDLSQVYGGLAASGQLAGYEVTHRFYEIGTPSGLTETDQYLREHTMPVSDYTRKYYEEVAAVAAGIDREAVDRMIDILLEVRSSGGRLFIIGVGGGAGHAGHAVNDFRKICGIESYAPTDNVSELTARINDDGWSTAYANWLRGQPSQGRGCAAGFFSRRRRCGKEYLRQHRRGTQVGKVGRRANYRRGWTRRRLYARGRGRLRCGADRQSRDGDTTHRGVSGGSVARHRKPPKAVAE